MPYAQKLSFIYRNPTLYLRSTTTRSSFRVH